MKTTAFALLASAALASAQLSYNDTTGEFVCAQPGGSYCAGDSLQTDIIIRCNTNSVGQPGRCSDNLDGEPPIGNYPSLCYQTSNTSGDASCEKNCIVYASSAFTLPASLCEPTYTASSSAVSSSEASATSSSAAVTTSASAGSTGGSGGGGNVTVISTASVSASKTPVSPSSTSTTVTAGAPLNNAGGFFAVIGLVAAYFL